MGKIKLPIRQIFFFIVLAAFAGSAQSQNIPSNISNINVDDLSDAQLQDFLKKAKSSGLSMDEIESAAKAKGFSQEQIDKLKNRIGSLSAEPKTVVNERSSREYNFGKQEKRKNQNQNQSDSSSSKYGDVFEKLKKNIFGSELFSNKNLTFEPDLKLPTPQNYQLGPNDELIIDVFGLNEANFQLTVSPSGTIRIPNLGPITVNGLTIEQASKVITSRLSQIYSGLKDGSTSVQVNLGNIRSINVTIMGEVTLPGTYTLPSLATVFNGLYASGGPTENGSFRNIQLVRNSKIVANIDIYDFLLKGDQKNNLRLQDQDVIRVNPYQNRVSIFGEVKAPGYFEMLPNESLKDLIGFAGGFTEKAYTGIIKVLKNDKKQKSIADIFEEKLSTYKPQNGDRYIVEQILNKFSNRVVIKGAVYREGPFALEKGLTLTKLISKADGLRGDAFLSRGYIKRTHENYTSEVISFNLKNIIDKSAPDITLQKDDEVNIPSSIDLKEVYKVKIEGEVISPGDFDFSDNMSLEDLIIMAGGLKESASLNRIEISRRIKDEESSSKENKSEIFNFDLHPGLSKEASESKFVLKPFDIVSVRRSPFYKPQQLVTVEGEVMYPGNYAIKSKKGDISDLVLRAGGLTPEAYPDGAVLIRKNLIAQAQKEIVTSELKKNSNPGDSVAVDMKELIKPQDFVGIQLRKIMKSPHSKYDLFLEEGDVIRIPRMLQTVKVSGNVYYPVNVRYIPGKRAKYYITQAGGYTENAKRSKLYVVNSNGSGKGTKNFLFFNIYPKVTPGAQILAPSKSERRKMSPQEVLAMTSAAASLALIVVTLSNVLKR